MIPDINSAGIFTLESPFDTLMVTDVPYTCVAVRELSDIIAAGINPKERYYDEPFAIPAERYQADVAIGACIVSLMSPSGDIIRVPSTYIKSFPKGGGIPYTTVALAINLSAIPKSMDLSYLKTQMQDLVLGTLGVENAAIHMLTLSPDALIDYDSHSALLAARQAKITNRETDRAARIRLEQQVALLKAKNEQLERYILNTKKP